MYQLPSRLRSIDVFRSLTMFFMIFLNDVDGVTNIPEWIKHAGEHTDGLGFADTIFPSFLFIVGLSLPFAVQNRLREGKGRLYIAFHIILRALALIIMGFLHVNMESYSNTSLLPEPMWEILITIGFFLIWLDYPKTISVTKRYLFQATGVILLVAMAIIYKGEAHGKIIGLRTHWWGILGLIGWAYLASALTFLFTGGKLFFQVIAFIFFLSLNIISNVFPQNIFSEFVEKIPLFGDGSMAALVMAGVAISTLYKELILQNKNGLFWSVLVFFGVLMIAFGFIIRPFGGISKIESTPAWVSICTGISILVFGLMIYIVDIKGKDKWARIIRPAGTSTLTCYLIPYLLYSFFEIIHFDFPDFFNEGIGGIIRSFATAFVVIFIAGLLEKKHLTLRI